MVLGVFEVIDDVEEFTVILRLLADSCPEFSRITVAVKSSPGTTLSGSCFTMLIRGFCWISTSLFTFTGTGNFRLLPSETLIQTSGKYTPVSVGARIRNEIGIDWPGPSSPTRLYPPLITSMPFPTIVTLSMGALIATLVVVALVSEL
ncbi:MAG: hypothetical protein A4E38_01065 [Methanoregulaceae archaeon PtaB.Bin108]|nr:MAG: hypothetical protein A4E38_01065 [Methanoregulaceae archaeon PtaB.Bin108]